MKLFPDLVSAFGVFAVRAKRRLRPALLAGALCAPLAAAAVSVPATAGSPRAGIALAKSADAARPAGFGLLTPTGMHYGDCCYPTSMATADLTGQGRTDIVTGNGLSYDISVLLASPLGGYGDPVSLPLDNPMYGYVAVAVGDVNGDGHPDIVAAGYADSTVAAYLGDGSGGFGSPTPFGAANSLAPRAIALADINEDGHPDIVIASADSNNVSLLLGDGAGSFGAASNFNVGTAPNSVAVADVTGDGHLDIVTANMTSDDVSVLAGDGGGGFGRAANYSIGPNADPWSVAIGDVTGDGHPDIVTANAGNDGSPFPPPELPGTVSLLVNDGSGAFAAAVQMSAGDGDGRAHSVAIGDVTGDGHADIVVTRPLANTAAILVGDGSGGFADAVTVPTSVGPTPVAIADVTGDGIADVVTANAVSPSVSILPGDGNGRVGFAGNFPAGAYADSVASADLDDDGNTDIVTANAMSNDVSVLLGDGTGGFAPEVRYAVDYSPTWIVIGDVNEDGHPDLVVANLGGGDVSVLLGDGSGAFGSAQNFGVGGDFESPYAVALGDANGDGHLDIATANTNISNDSVSVMLGDGSGGFAAPVLYTINDDGFFGVQDVILADVTGDGNADIVTANIGSSDLALMVGDGSGAFAAPVELMSDAGPVVVAAGDVTGDGIVDLVTVNQTAQDVSVLVGDGAGGFAAPVNWPIYPPQVSQDYDPWPWGMTLADIDGDGSLDIVTANTQNDTVSVLPNSGSGIFDVYLVFGAGANPGAVTAADVDGDGDLDVITANRGNNGVSVLTNQAGGGNNDEIFADGFDVVPIR